MDLCGSATDSWFFNDPLQFSMGFKHTNQVNNSKPASLRNVDDLVDEPWSIRFLKTLQSFSRNYQPVHGYLCLVLCTFGLLTNVLNFVVLTRPNMRTSINVVLAAIALCDAGTMCSYLIYVVHFYIINHGVCLTEIYTYNWMVFILFHSLWSILLHSSSIWLAVLLAFMRLTVMRRAKLSHTFLKPTNVWKPMAYIYAPLAILCVPVIFTHSVVEIDLEPCGNVSANFGSIESKSKTKNFLSVGYTVLPSQTALSNDCILLRVVLLINGIFFKLLPCLLLAFSIWRLLRTLDAAKKRNTRVLRRRSDVKNGSVVWGHAKYFNSRTTKMLLAILSLFLFTELPQAFIATLSGFNPNDFYFKIYPAVGDLLDLLSLLNSGVNFVLYCCMSSRFRSTFMDLFAPMSWRRILRCRHRRFSLSDQELGGTGNGTTMSGLRFGNGSSPLMCSIATATPSRRTSSMVDSKLNPDDIYKNPRCYANRRRLRSAEGQDLTGFDEIRLLSSMDCRRKSAIVNTSRSLLGVD